MKKILIIIFSLLFIDSVCASNLYVSKKDIDTQDYVSDCDFLLYDENDVIVDAWIATNNTHEIENIKSGTYTLVERPRIENTFSNDLSVFHEIDLNEQSLEIVLYNTKIETPRNLNSNQSSLLIGLSIMLLGLTFIYLSYRKFYFF